MADQPVGLAEGRVISNPISGERIVIRQSGEDTGGRLLAFDLFLPPGGHVPAAHVHPVQEERFSVVSGRLRFRVGRDRVFAQAGQTVLVRPGMAHWFGNAGDGVAHIRVEVRPALRMQELLEKSGAIGIAGHRGDVVVPRLADLALLLLEFQHELAIPNVPAAVARVTLAPFAWFARRRSGSARG